MTLADLIDRNAAFTPNKPALVFDNITTTYAEFAERVAATAAGLQTQLGIQNGDRVAVLALNHPDTLTLLFACARIGALLVPLNWRLAVPEQLFILRDAGAKVLLVGSDFTAAGNAIADTLPDLRTLPLDHLPHADSIPHAPNADLTTPLLIVYTSGTTGRPKGAVLTQQALLANSVMSQHMHAMTAQDRVLCVLPLFHVGGLNIQTTPALLQGATVILHARFDPGETLAALANDKPSLVVLVPATMQAMLAHPAWPIADLSSLRALATGSSIVPQKLIDAFTARGVPVLQVYGATETCPIAIYTRLGGDLARRGSTGLSGLLCETRLVDDAGNDVPPGTPGEILVRGPNVLREYWGNPAATAETLHDGWYATGDIAARDADGYFAVLERKRNVIISGGENIYPAEIERALQEHPAVQEAAVIGVPDPRWQEVPVAYVVLRANATASAEMLRDFLATQLARFKLPREVIAVGDLPRNALGKVQHFRLKQDWPAG